MHKKLDCSQITKFLESKKGYKKLAQDEEEKKPLLEKDDKKSNDGSHSSFGQDNKGYKRFY